MVYILHAKQETLYGSFPPGITSSQKYSELDFFFQIYTSVKIVAKLKTSFYCRITCQVFTSKTMKYFSSKNVHFNCLTYMGTLGSVHEPKIRPLFIENIWSSKHENQ